MQCHTFCAQMLFLKHSGPYVFEYVMSSLLLLKSFPMQMKHARTNTSSPHWDMLPSFSQMLLYGEPPSYLKSPLGTCLERMRLKITKNRPRVQHAGITCCMLYVWAFAQKSGEKKKYQELKNYSQRHFQCLVQSYYLKRSN